MVILLDQINGPSDVRSLDESDLPILATEIRSRLVERVSATGGHLGPNLGVVELTIALHRVFHSPDDAIIWDTGHQAYVHKMLTGRAGDFEHLRQYGGLSGYPSRTESEHDIVENSHASTSLSYADGIAKAWERRGVLGRRHVVAVVGDGALTGGMAWEALNNIATSNRPIVIVVNDNERSYAPTIGGVAHHLATLRTTGGYERVMSWGKRVLSRTPIFGRPVYGALHGMKKGLKDVVAPQGMFEDLGLKYIGPIDGHDEAELEFALIRARDFFAPVIVHAITQKGRGYPPAENDVADHFHGVGVIDPDTGQPIGGGGPTWTRAFADELVQIGHDRPDVVAITAAMLSPTGLDAFAEVFPDRTFDVGIAEQHAITSAAGMAFGGLHPVVAMYATFLNRALDQLLMDCALHRAGVTVVLDRAGVTGEDGASHHGMWDMSMVSMVPGLRVAAPRDGARLRQELREAVAIDDGPTVVRFPKGGLPEDIAALERNGAVDVLYRSGDESVLLIAVGALAGMALEVAEGLLAQGIGSVVIDPRWVKPVPLEIVEMARSARMVVTVEDGVRAGGIGTAVQQLLQDADIVMPVRSLGIPEVFLPHGKRAEILAEAGLTAQDITRGIVEAVAQRSPEQTPVPYEG
jgi:1-deoxy-D-xylulose-5-phosphate synthase